MAMTIATSPPVRSSFLGTLVLDRPFEITGNETGGRGVDFHGSQIRLVAGGEIISDKQSPFVDTVDFPKGLDLTLAAESGLSLFDGLISNLGLTEDEGGDIMLSTDFPNGRVRISGPLILAEDLVIESNGAIDIEGQTIIGVQATVRLTALQSTTAHDVSLAGQTEIYASGGLGRIIFENKSVDGQVIIGEGVLLSAANIDFCDVKGGSDNIDFLGADIRGKILLPGTPDCE